MKQLAKFRKSKIAKILLTALTLSAIMCLAVFAEGETATATIDVSSLLTDAVSEIAKTLMMGLGIVVTGIIGFTGAKIAIVKIISFVQTMVGQS